jgi:hypothetical protein
MHQRQIIVVLIQLLPITRIIIVQTIKQNIIQTPLQKEQLHMIQKHRR